MLTLRPRRILYQLERHDTRAAVIRGTVGIFPLKSVSGTTRYITCLVCEDCAVKLDSDAEYISDLRSFLMFNNSSLDVMFSIDPTPILQRPSMHPSNTRRTLKISPVRGRQLKSQIWSTLADAFHFRSLFLSRKCIHKVGG